MRNSNKLVWGIGIKGNLYQTTENGKKLPVYVLWSNMLKRCTQKYRSKHPTYIGVTCSENFKSYSFFYEWCQEQTGFNSIDGHGKSLCLDKDILVRGNKLYSEDVCVFVPQRINKLLIKRDACRGDWPVGVFWDKKRGVFKAQSRDGNSKKKHLGYFKTLEESFKAYKTFKEAVIKEVANEYKDQLDPRAYQALMNYEVNEND
jgi:hypothetical protein